MKTWSWLASWVLCWPTHDWRPRFDKKTGVWRAVCVACGTEWDYKRR